MGMFPVRILELLDSLPIDRLFSEKVKVGGRVALKDEVISGMSGADQKSE